MVGRLMWLLYLWRQQRWLLWLLPLSVPHLPLLL
jgi:hypothetical protein